MNLLGSPRGRRVLFATLYASEGAPIGYVWWALPTKLTDAGVDVARVTTITAVATLAWTLKFLWAPLIDTLRGPRWGYRSWIITAQIGMGAALLPLLFYPMAEYLALATALLVTHAFLAATQDASVDALCIASVPVVERGTANAWMQVGMLTSRAVFGGGALIMERHLGERAVLIALIACIWFSMLLVMCLTREPSGPPNGPEGSFDAAQAWRSFAITLRRAFSRGRTWFALAFAAIGGAGYEAVGAIAGPLLRSAGASTRQVGIFLGLAVVICMGLGALAGGWRGDRVGRARAVIESMLGIALVIAGLSASLRFLADPLPSGFVALAMMYFLIGTFTVSSYAMFMDLTDERLGATEFSAFMGATNLCEAWSGMLVGRLALAWSYSTAILVPAGLSLLAIPIVLVVGRTVSDARARRAECP